VLVLTQRLPTDPSAKATYTLALTAEERARSRLRFDTEEGATVQLGLPRGTVLRDGDLLRTDDGDAVVYDNGLGASDDIDSANPQAIRSGSIVVHKGK